MDCRRPDWGSQGGGAGQAGAGKGSGAGARLGVSTRTGEPAARPRIVTVQRLHVAWLYGSSAPPEATAGYLQGTNGAPTVEGTQRPCRPTRFLHCNHPEPHPPQPAGRTWSTTNQFFLPSGPATTASTGLSFFSNSTRAPGWTGARDEHMHRAGGLARVDAAYGVKRLGERQPRGLSVSASGSRPLQRALPAEYASSHVHEPPQTVSLARHSTTSYYLFGAVLFDARHPSLCMYARRVCDAGAPVAAPVVCRSAGDPTQTRQSASPAAYNTWQWEGRATAGVCQQPTSRCHARR